MDRINSARFLKCGLIYFAILFFLPLLNTSYIYAGDAIGISSEGENYRTKGYEAQQRGDIDTAIEWYQKAASVKPDYASPHNDLGILFETKGWLDRAEAEYEKALALDPDYKEVHTNMALLYERKGELEKAAFHWMRRYKLGNPNDPWNQEARERLEKLGLLEKTEKAVKAVSPANVEQKTTAVEEPQKKEAPVKVKKEKVVKRPAEGPTKKKPEPKPKAKKGHGWAMIGPEKKKEPAKASESSKNIDKELQESLRLAEERLRREKGGKKKIDAAVNSEANAAYSKAKDYYNKGEYAKALDVIRLVKQDSGQSSKPLLELEDEIKFKMKEERIEDYYKEGMIHYHQKDFAGARKEFEAMLNILPE